MRCAKVPAGWTTAWTNARCSVHCRASNAGPHDRMPVFTPSSRALYGAALLERWLTGKIVRPSPRGPGPRTASPGLLRRIIPCLDVKDGRVVKGIRFQDLRDGPATPAEAGGAVRSAGRRRDRDPRRCSFPPRGAKRQVETVRRVRAAIRIPADRGRRRFAAWTMRGKLLAAGADKVSVNTAAVRRPELLDRVGAGLLAASVSCSRSMRGGAGGGLGSAGDRGAREIARPPTRWRGPVTVRVLARGEILLTSWDRDGTRGGGTISTCCARCRTRFGSR